MEKINKNDLTYYVQFNYWKVYGMNSYWASLPPVTDCEGKENQFYAAPKIKPIEMGGWTNVEDLTIAEDDDTNFPPPATSKSIVPSES